MSFKRRQSDIIYRVGMVFGPLRRLLEQPTAFDPDERRRTIARFVSEHSKLRSQIVEFSRMQPGHDFHNEAQRAVLACERVFSMFTSNKDVVIADLDQSEREVLDALTDVPVPLDVGIYAAQTPFTAYSVLLLTAMLAPRSLYVVDRYLDSSVFHRYLYDIDRRVEMVTVVTWPRSKFTSPRDRARWDALMDVSKLFGTERGHMRYRMVTNTNIHDRYLMTDETILHLGGSFSAIGQAHIFAVTRQADTTDNREAVENLAAINPPDTIELFGPTQPTHLS